MLLNYKKSIKLCKPHGYPFIFSFL
jgi:hypothetical protein